MTFYAAGTLPNSWASSRNGTAEEISNLSLSSLLAPANGMGQVENNPYALTLSFVPLMTIFGNALVILAVCSDKALRTVTNLLITSLAVSDLLVAMCVMFFAVYYEFNSFVWDLGPTLCNLYIGADVACSTASILNLLAISIDRYIAISHPLAYCQIGTNSRAYVSIALVWSVSISVAIPLAFGANHIEREHECAFTNPVFMISSSILSFFLPCLAMIALYAVVFRRLRERENARKARKRHAALNGTETALITNALMGGARMARQIARSHLKDQLLMELSIQTSSFPTASRSEEDEEEEEEEDDDYDDEEEDDEEEGTDACESADRDTARRGHRRRNIHNKKCCLVAPPHCLLRAQTAEEAQQQQQRRPTLGLMMNGGMPFPMAPMNPLQLPSTALTEAERRVRGWRRKRTLRLMRRCNTLPSTVMQRQKAMTSPQGTTTTQRAIGRRGESVAAEDKPQQQMNATKCQEQCHNHQQTDGPQKRRKSSALHCEIVKNAAQKEANDDNEKVLLGHNMATGDEHEQLQQQTGDATAENDNAKGDDGGEGEERHGQPPSPTPIHLCNSFGDELTECFPFIDQNEQQHEDHNNSSKRALLPADCCSAVVVPPSVLSSSAHSPSFFPLSDGIFPSVCLPNPSENETSSPSSSSSSADPSSSSFNSVTFKLRFQHGANNKSEIVGKMRKKQKEKEKQCHRNGNANLSNHFNMRRTHSERHPTNFTPWHCNRRQLIRRLSADERCTACAGWASVDGKNDNNRDNSCINYDNNNNNCRHNYVNNLIDGNNDNATVAISGNAAQRQSESGINWEEVKEMRSVTKDCAHPNDAILALRNGGKGMTVQQQQQQQQKQQKRRKQYGGTMLARFIQWTRRRQRRVIAEFGIRDGPRLVNVIESATTVGVISAVDHRDKSKGRRGDSARRSVRISSRSPQKRHSNRQQKQNNGNAKTSDNNYNDNDHDYDQQQNHLSDCDQSPEWNDAGGDSSAALSSSYRLLLEANNCCLPDTDRRRNSSGGGMMEQFSTRTGHGNDDGSLRNMQNGTVPRRNGGGCQRASTVTGVPKKISCASSTFSSSPLRYIRQAFRRSLVPIIEEGRKPSRALLKRATRQMRREQKATVTLAVVLAVFLCCWVPFFALHLSNAICLLSGGAQCVHLLAMFLSTWLGYLNSSLNPLIYTVFDKRFRKAFRNLLGCSAAVHGSAATSGGRRGTRPKG